jgi:hypothetical protein
MGIFSPYAAIHEAPVSFLASKHAHEYAPGLKNISQCLLSHFSPALCCNQRKSLDLHASIRRHVPSMKRAEKRGQINGALQPIYFYEYS